MSSDNPVQWRTPNGVMRKFRLRKLQDQTRRRASLSTLSVNMTKNFESPVQEKAGVEVPVKSQNPFAKKRSASDTNQVTKKRILSSSEYERSVENILQPSDLFSDSNSSEGPGKDPIQPPKNKMPFVYLEEDSIQGLFINSKTPLSAMHKNPENLDIGCENLPMDWTIKRKARFLSNSTFGWCARIKGADEANAITQATRCHQSDITPKPNFGNPSDEQQKTWKIELGRCVTYWQQPCIPWLTLFPRFGNSVKLHSGSTPPVPQNDDVMKSFYDSWVVSLRSAYQLTRERLCPYFYICAQQYTALFRAPGVSGETEVTCALTPVTSGFRQSLQKEGIEFSRAAEKKDENNQKSPLDEENKENASTTNASINPPDGRQNDCPDLENQVEKQNGGDDDGNQTDDDTTWDLINKNIQLSGPKELARQSGPAETSTRNTVIIRGTTNTQLLFNYIINSKNSIMKCGPQAFIPPTIIAPVAFQGASLQKSTVRSGIARSYSESSVNRSGVQSDSQQQQRQFSLDISGPLLPHSIVGVTELLHKTQGFHGFKAAFSSAMYTAPFNNTCPKTSDSNSDQRALPGTKDLVQNFGVSNKMLDILLNIGDSWPTCLNQVTMSNDLYSWNV